MRGKNFSAGEDVVGNVALGTVYSYDGLLCMSAKVGTVHNHHKTYALLNCPRKRVLKNGEFIVPKHIQILASYSVNNNSNIRSIVEEQYQGLRTIMRHAMNDLPNLNNIGFKTTGVIKSFSMCNCGVMTSIRK